MADKQEAQKGRLESYERETQEEKAARVARERATEDAAAEALKSIKTPFGIELIYDPNDTDTAAPADYLTGAALETANVMLQKANEIIKEQITEFVNSKDFDRITAVFSDAKQWTLDELERSPQTALVIITAVFYSVDYIPDYLRANNIKPSLSEFAAYTQNEKGEQISPLDRFLKYLQTSDIEGAANAGKEAAEELNIISHRPKNIPVPVDRLTDKLQKTKAAPANGILNVHVLTKPESPKSPETFLALDFSEVLKDFPEIKTNIDGYDMRVLSSIGGIMKTDQSIMTLDEIYHSMGNTSEISRYDRNKINNTLTKFRATMRGGNQSEIAAKYKYDLIVFDGPILHFDRITGVKVKGKKTDTAIKVYKYPTLLEYAEKRGQLPAVPMPVLQSGVNQTDFTITIENYLIKRIVHAKSGYESNKILYSTLYENCGADSRQKQQRAREYTERFLNHYKDVDWIKGHKNTKDAIIILL